MGSSWWRALVSVAWFVLAAFVLWQVLGEPAGLDEVFAAWLGGVLSVPFGLMVWRWLGSLWGRYKVS